ncbi:2133_t:CDS:2 [Paraglomus occultum]|uniref:2133_t:CDS:1 n=1 Tax=Paraglomus occultum TaxID=144539 RepID=A0A9N9A5M3_9GLOM|nr:2133_t:CDS:2 [Paraglomus occultum]
MLSSLGTEESATGHELELIASLKNEIASLKAQFHEFHVIVHSKLKKGFKWTVNVDHATLEGLKETIYDIEQTPTLASNNSATLEFGNGSIKHKPRNDQHFRDMLRGFISQNELKFIVYIKTPSKPFSDYDLQDVCELYEIGSEDEAASLTRFPSFACGSKDLEDESSQDMLMSVLKFLCGVVPLDFNESSRSTYVLPFLVAGASLYKEKFNINVIPGLYIKGDYGHGPVDYAIKLQNSRIVGVTKVKHKDFEKGVAQNAIQIESALSNCRKRKADVMEEEDKTFGIITDAKEWRFIQCSYDGNGKPNFKLSRSILVDYESEDIELKVKTVLGHIAWFLEETQKPAEDLRQQRAKRQRRRK